MTERRKRLAVVGAGWLGSEVARRSAVSGTRVVATTRSGKWRGDRPTPPGVELQRFDIVADDEEALRAIVANVEVATFCYAPSRDQNRGQLYVEGAARIAQACRDSGLERVIYASSTSAMADEDGWVDEDSDMWPDAPRGRVQREAETALRAGLEGADVPWTILRLAGLYGPRRELGRLYRAADTEHVRPGDGLEATNLVHFDDATEAVLAAIDLPKTESGVIQVCDDDHRSRREVTAGVARASGLPEPRWEEPAAGRPVRGKRVSNTRMKERLGLRLRHPTHHA